MTDDPQRTTDGVTRRRYLTLTAASGAALGLGAGAGAAAQDHTSEDVTITSDNSPHPVDIAATVYRPGGASADDPAPMILHSHGWGGSRTSSEGAFGTELDAGFGVLSFDQRGHGASGGQAYVQSPEREGQDVIAILDYVADLPWVARSKPKGIPIPKKDNPTVFAMGRSYGGGYQLVGALTETAEKGYTRFDALAPQITWYDLTESLAPEDVVRSTWVLALYTLGAGMVPQHVHEGLAYGATTGQWPDGEPLGEPDLDSRFSDNGTVGFVDRDIRLNVPVLFGQGLSDNLFNFNQAWKNFERGLTDRARAKSAVVGYNGGHALPNVLPLGSNLASLSGVATPPATFAERRLAFFEAMRDDDGDARSVVGAPYELQTASGERRVAVETVDDRTDFGEVDLSVYGDGAGGLGVANTSTVASTTGVGAPVHLPLANGPLTVAGVPDLSATVTALGVDQRLFFGLSVGESPATAQVLQNNVMPLHEADPVMGVERTVELPGVAADIGPREQLYLTVTAVSDMFPIHGSIRTPGTVVLEDLSVGVPLTEN
ncbi:alpha/beta hydrolase [Haloglomus halophilum]|uniref:alpha/beta hydrolase n=1 Tax=Haloglomus halophilum TaxID=2962672 RepID=UPI0020C9C3F5|nr:CocE/NonD family hydrolase [Haloglomus halophilum]